MDPHTDPDAALAEPAAETLGQFLSQSAIDDLMGDGNLIVPPPTGLMALVNSSLVNYERLPMLEVVFDRLVRLLSTSLRHLTSDNVEVTLERISSVRFGDYLNSVPLPALMAVVEAEAWDNLALMTVDAALAYAIIDVLLGGRRGTPAMRIEGRPFTSIERGLVERLVRVVLTDLSTAFEPLTPVAFRFERLEVNPRFAAIARPSNAAVLVRLRVEMEDRGGPMDLVIPYATLEPVRELLLQMFLGEKFGRDRIWEGHLATELQRTTVRLDAVLGEADLTLEDVLSWSVGTRITFDMRPTDTLPLRCGEIAMFRGRMGRQRDQIAVRVVEDLRAAHVTGRPVA